MKRIFTLFLTMLTALCASASDYTFKVEVDGQHIIITPSAQTERWTYNILDQEAIELCKKKGLPLETEQQIADAADAIGMPATELVVSKPFSPDICPDGEYTVVMTAYESLTSDNIVKVQVEKVTVDVVPDDDVTFAFSCTGETCTITPSNNESEYAAFVISSEDLPAFHVPETLEPLTGVGSWALIMATTIKPGEARTGKNELTKADWLSEIKLNGRCVVVAFGVKTFKNGEKENYSNSTPFSYFIWNVGETTTAIDTIETPASSMGKTFKDGKFIINGNVLIDGTLVK